MKKKHIFCSPVRILLLTLVLSICFSISLDALNPRKHINHYVHHTWTTRDGLPQNTINAVIQDETGRMWIATDKGLTSFDGTEFKRFDKSNTPAIKSDSITALYITKNNTLCIGSYGGGIVFYRDNHFYSPAMKLPNNLVQCITEAKDNSLWIGTVGSGILLYKVNPMISKTVASITVSDGLSNNIVFAIHADRKDKIWIGTANGLNYLDEDNVGFTVFTTADGLCDNNIKTFFEDSKGYIWIGTPSGLNFIKNRKTALTSRRFHAISIADGLSGNYIRSIREDKHGSIWVATNKGLNRISPKFRRGIVLGKVSAQLPPIEHFTAGDGLSDNSLLSVYEDRRGNLWIGTAGGGLNVLQDGKFSFFTAKDGLSSNFTKAIYQDKKGDGSIWIGTDGNGLNRYKKGNFRKYTIKDGLSSNNIESLYGDGKKGLWIGTVNGLNWLDIQKGNIRVFSIKDGLSNQSIKALFTDSRGDTWIGTFGGGLNRFKDGKFEVFDAKRGLSDNFVTAITETGDGHLWIGTNNGLNLFENGKFRVFNSKNGLSANMIMDIYADKDGAIWVATKGGGLNRYKNGRFSRFDTGIPGVTDNDIYRIIEDSRDNLWLTSNRGIFSVSRSDLNRYAEGKNSCLSPYHFGEEDGLKTAVCTGGFQPAGWKATDGKIWFPTIKGIAVMDTGNSGFRIDQQLETDEDVKKKALESSISFITVVREQSVVIDKLVVDGIRVPIGPKIRLPRETKKVEFFFRVINYTGPDKVVFKYRLLGYEDRWLNSSASRVVYHDLPSGRYNLKVLARNTYGDWVFRGDSVSFFVEHPFYHSFWFYFVLTFILAVGLVGVPRWQQYREDRIIEEYEKYKSSSLSNSQSKSYLQKLVDLMEKEKPFLDPKLTIQDLADMLECPKETVSQVINEQMDMNFNNFLNKYRVEEAKIKLADPKENQFVLMKIAFDAGFNSKSVFNASFKKFTGMSPSQYRKKNQNL